MEIKFGKFKGQTVEQLAKRDDGRQWLSWYADKLDPSDAQWGKLNAKNKKIIMDELAKYTNVKEPVKEIVEVKPSVLASPTSVSPTTKLEMIDKKLEKNFKEMFIALKKLDSLETVLLNLDAKITEAQAIKVEVEQALNGEVKSPEDIAWEN